MPSLYEIGITGRIGPLIQACLPGFHSTEEGESTVLTGTVRGPEDLHRVLALLDTHGLPAQQIRLTYRDDDTTPPG